MVDQPNESRWHRQPVALLGGIAIFISFALVFLLKVDLGREGIFMLSGGGMIFALGLLDDIFGMRPGIKLAAQIAIAFGVAHFGIRCKILPYNWMNISLTVLWIVGLTNALNLLDNMDGLASGVSTITAFSILALSLYKGHPGVALSCLVLAGSCLGFLRYNFNPAKIFMGDCGSLFLGYMLATLAVLGGWQHHSPIVASLLSPVLILGIPVFDTTLVTILRFAHKRMPWEGGKDHSSHRLVHILAGREKGAVLIIYGLGILAGGLGLIAARCSSLVAILIMTTFILGLAVFGIKLAKVDC
jgi:UDP-GlcNAc:undecaprenyl-phosphate GlcNAc-1-phosphate transferase